MRQAIVLTLLLILAGCNTATSPTAQPAQPSPQSNPVATGVAVDPAGLPTTTAEPTAPLLTPQASPAEQTETTAEPTAPALTPQASPAEQTETTGAPTEAPVATERYVPEAPVPLILTQPGNWAEILGGAKGDQWFSAHDLSNEIPFADPYQLVMLDGLGAEIPPGPIRSSAPICPENWIVTVPQQSERTVGVAGAGWELLPRPIEQLSTDQQVYNDALVALLEEQGIDSPTPQITQLLRADLEGDGTDEVLMVATRLSEGISLPTASAGDYSLVALRKIVDGEVQTQLLVSEVYVENPQYTRPSLRTIPAIADLNGDGTMEVVVDSQYYEGSDTRVFSMEGDELREVLQSGCGL